MEQCLYISGYIPRPNGVVLSAASHLAVRGSSCLSSTPISVAGLQLGPPHVPANRIAGPSAFLPKGPIDSATKVSARSSSTPDEDRGIVSTEANLGGPSRGDFESMARRRFQDPRPRRRGKWWDRTRGVIANYLVPEFGKLSLRDLTPLTLQRYFSGLAASPLAHESKDKIKDVLSSILGSAVQYGLLVKNPVEGIRLPADKRGKRKTKPHVTPEQFKQFAELIPEPYATMVFVAVWTGLRVSELRHRLIDHR